MIRALLAVFLAVPGRAVPPAFEVAQASFLRELEATAILEYFAPLKAWFDEQNKGQLVGWKAE